MSLLTGDNSWMNQTKELSLISVTSSCTKKFFLG